MLRKLKKKQTKNSIQFTQSNRKFHQIIFQKIGALSKSREAKRKLFLFSLTGNTIDSATIMKESQDNLKIILNF